MRYRLIASDFDSTIYDGEQISPRVRRAISDYRAAGGKFVVATGRVFSSIERKLPMIGADDEVIACQGSVIFRASTHTVLERFPLDREVARKALRYFESKGDVCHLYGDFDFYVEKANPLTAAYASYCSVEPHVVGQPLSEYLDRAERVNKVIGIVDPAVIDLKMAELREILGESADITKSTSMFLEITSSRAGKGSCLLALAEQLGIPASETVAVGDNLNDLSMVRAAALGAAVGNAVPALKEAADVVLPSLEEDGVAVLIEDILADRL